MRKVFFVAAVVLLLISMIMSIPQASSYVINGPSVSMQLSSQQMAEYTGGVPSCGDALDYCMEHSTSWWQYLLCLAGYVICYIIS